jgi:hypothetical protein
MLDLGKDINEKSPWKQTDCGDASTKGDSSTYGNAPSDLSVAARSK